MRLISVIKMELKHLEQKIPICEKRLLPYCFMNGSHPMMAICKGDNCNIKKYCNFATNYHEIGGL